MHILQTEMEIQQYPEKTSIDGVNIEEKIRKRNDFVNSVNRRWRWRFAYIYQMRKIYINGICNIIIQRELLTLSS